MKTLRILGIRGIPAGHGGFETFAERLSLHLSGKGWEVTVYCQDDDGGDVRVDEWNGIRRVHIPSTVQGPAGTVVFDWRSIRHCMKTPGLVLTLGYNTAVFCAALRMRGITNLINMDGLEWKRAKWSLPMKAWFYANERLGCRLGNHLIADHPEIAAHLASRVPESKITKITMIPYGADRIEAANEAVPDCYGLESGGYAVMIARPEPENSILEVVRAWSRRRRGLKLVVLGRYEPGHPYHQAVRDAASEEVIFPGAVYERDIINALRFFAQFYIHGHQVGGTNPSLVEALGAGSAVLAHDNRFNRWVAGPGACYFNDEDNCARRLDELAGNEDRLGMMRRESRERHQEFFTWGRVLAEYEALLERWS